MPRGTEKKPILHRWALLDKAGKTRGTCEACYKHEARAHFKSLGRSVKSPWTIVNRGPVKDDSLVLAADPEPKAPTFKVGDRVRYVKRRSESSCSQFDLTVPLGTFGTIKADRGGCWWLVEWDGHPYPEDESGRKYEMYEEGVEIQPAPEPKAEEFKPGDPVCLVKGAQLPVGSRGIILEPGHDGGFRIKWNGGNGVLWAHAAQIEHLPQDAGPDVLAAKDAEIATLKAERDALASDIARIRSTVRCGYCEKHFILDEHGGRDKAVAACLHHQRHECDKSPMRKEVEALKAEVRRLEKDLASSITEQNNWRNAYETEHLELLGAQEARSWNKRKLDDIQALMRADEIMRRVADKNIPAAIQSVLDR